MKVFPVILCGGSGKRLWPLSREQLPKQFIALNKGLSSYQHTLQRIQNLAESFTTLEVANPVVVCHEEQRFLVAQQAKAMDTQLFRIILEPERRNTAPALSLAAHFLNSLYSDAMLLVLSADHIIDEPHKLNESIASLITELGSTSAIGLLGVRPTYAHTGYGYIKVERDLSSPLYNVVAFKEKPSRASATEYLRTGNYFWNSGNLCVSATTWLSIIDNFDNDLSIATERAIRNGLPDLDFLRVEQAAFLKASQVSIDHAILEHWEKLNELKVSLRMAELDCEWFDIGAWESIENLFDKDTDGNRIRGDVVTLEANRNLIFSSDKLVTALGVNDLVIIETPDAVLVANKDRSQEVRYLVDLLHVHQRPEATKNLKEYRPWGYFEWLHKDKTFIVKRLLINPRNAISLQSHQYRAEHWIVVIGKATVVKGEEVFSLLPSESIHIPARTLHRLANDTDQPLEVIEVQIGEKLCEADILRIQDCYGRAK